MVESVTIGNATLYRGDAREILPSLSKGLVVVTDPVWPNCPADLIPGSEDPDGLWREAMSALPEPQRLVCVMRSDSDPRFLRHVPEALKFLRVLRLPYVIPAKIARILSGDEYAYWYGAPIQFQKGRQLIPGQSPAAQPANKKSGHPCSRSQAHFDWLVDWASDEGETVLDPFMGAGTTGVAAWKADRAFVGIEIDPRFFDLACERISRTQAEHFQFTRPAKADAPMTPDLFPDEGHGRGPYLKTRRRAATPAPAPAPAEPKRAPPKPDVPAKAAADSHRRPYLEMPERGLCKYIVCDGVSIDDKMCCGRPQREGSSFCDHHHRRCYKPWTPLALEA